jgi:hypothetical protein
MVNASELLINTVRHDKPKILIGLSQNGKRPGTDVEIIRSQNEAPPVNR